MLAGTPEDPAQEIKNFGEIVLEDGNAFSANISFCDTGTGTGGSGGAVMSELLQSFEQGPLA